MKNVIALWNKQRLYIENLWLYQRFINEKFFKKIVENFKNGWKMLYKAEWLLYYMQVFKRNYFPQDQKCLSFSPLSYIFSKGSLRDYCVGCFLLLAFCQKQKERNYIIWLAYARYAACGGYILPSKKSYDLPQCGKVMIASQVIIRLSP